MKRPFWKYRTYARPVDFGIHWITAHLADRALNEGETVEQYYLAGTLRKDKTIDDFREEISKLGGRVFKHVNTSRQQHSEEWIYRWEDGGLGLEYWGKNRGITFNVRCNNPQLLTLLRGLAEANIVRKKTKGRVYVVTSSDGHPELTEMGVAGEDFIDGNYAPDVVKEYRHVIEDLNCSDPCGKVVLLNGPPGTGKTHMVRAMMNEVERSTFILVPSNMIALLGGPDFLGLLIREQKKDSPLILIIEDADEAIVNRKEGSQSAISALLNFSDGIFGAMLNMRVVCTTNVKIDALDEAVMRDGRLCREINISDLDTIQANAIYERLTGKKGMLDKKFYTLANVYALAKDSGRKTKEGSSKRSNVAGFQLPKREEALDALDEQEQALEAIAELEYAVAMSGPGLDWKPATPSSYNPADDDDDLIDEDPPGYIFDDEDDEFDEERDVDTNPGIEWDDSED